MPWDIVMGVAPPVNGSAGSHIIDIPDFDSINW